LLLGGSAGADRVLVKRIGKRAGLSGRPAQHPGKFV